ncbi:jg10272, partial [Pararge aegeria aegeria]
LECPLMSTEVRKELKNPDFCNGPHEQPPVCLAVADMAASRMSKAFAILHMLSEDLQYKVSIADDAYNLYKNVKLGAQEELSASNVCHFPEVVPPPSHPLTMSSQINIPT